MNTTDRVSPEGEILELGSRTTGWVKTARKGVQFVRINPQRWWSVMYKDDADSFVPHVFVSREAAEAGYEHYKKIRRGNKSAQAQIALLQEQLAKLSAEIVRLKEERNDTEQ